jgi:hypothetical protein
MSVIISSNTDILPFNPFEALVERRIPLRKIDLNIDLDNESESEQKYESEKEKDSVLIIDKRNEKVDLDRDTILERLKQNQKFVTYCESSSHSIVDIVPEPAEHPIELIENTPINGRKLNKQIEIEPDKDLNESGEPEEPILDYQVPDEIPFSTEESREIKMDDKTIFIVCFGASSINNKPGKGAGESIPDTRKIEFEPLASIPLWRQKLCNDYEDPIKIDGRQWESISHYMIYSKYKNNTDTNVIEALYNYEKAQDIEKTGKWNTKKLKADLDFDTRKSQDMYHALFIKFTENKEMARLLSATKDATIMNRITSHKKEIFYELLWVREQLEPMRKSLVIRPTGQETGIIEKQKRGRKAKEQEIVEDPFLLQKTKLGKWADRLPMNKMMVKASSYYMNNRKMFITKINALFDKYRTEIQEETKREESGTGELVPIKKNEFL